MGADLFHGEFAKTRQAPRVLMRVCDAGPSCEAVFNRGWLDRVRMACRKCERYFRRHECGEWRLHPKSPFYRMIKQRWEDSNA